MSGLQEQDNTNNSELMCVAAAPAERGRGLLVRASVGYVHAPDPAQPRTISCRLLPHLWRPAGCGRHLILAVEDLQLAVASKRQPAKAQHKQQHTKRLHTPTQATPAAHPFGKLHVLCRH
jgi:hypothetical protein